MRVELTMRALYILRSLEKPDRKIIGAEIRKFQNDLPADLKKMKGSDNEWRLRAGAWRVLLEKHYDQQGTLYFVVNIIRRKDAYRH